MKTGNMNLILITRMMGEKKKKKRIIYKYLET